MQRITQTADDIIKRLSRIETAWQDQVSEEIEGELGYLRECIDKWSEFKKENIQELLDKNFRAFSSIFRFFLEFSKDEYQGFLREALPNGIGVTAFKKDPQSFADCLEKLGLITAINDHVNKEWSWTDVIIERLKLGRGSAIKGQKRGRFLENEVEAVIKSVFGDAYDKNCNFIGLEGRQAKAEFAIPSKDDPEILFEVKAYGATGSKQTDVLGDIGKIKDAKKHNMVFLFVTDGTTWNQRLSDLRKIIEFQNNGYI